MHQRKAASITIIIFLLLISTAAEAMATMATDAGGRLRFISGTPPMQAAQGWLKKKANERANSQAIGRTSNDDANAPEAYEGSTQMVALLLERGAKVNDADAEGGTALIYSRVARSR